MFDTLLAVGFTVVLIGFVLVFGTIAAAWSDACKQVREDHKDLKYIER